VVEDDPRAADRRRLLNFGLITLGARAARSSLGYRRAAPLRSVAVAHGMRFARRLPGGAVSTAPAVRGSNHYSTSRAPAATAIAPAAASSKSDAADTRKSREAGLV
jgi:hypothetical protein